MNKQFWTLNKNGNEVLRNLEEEHKGFTLEKYNQGEFDGNNFIWYELFDMYSHDSNGCDYERRGCFIKEGDTVVDIGANIGVFAYRAELRGAAQVICFEPMDLTFNSLKKNIGPKTTAHKLAVGGKNEFKKFVIHTDYSHLGGGFDITKEEIRNGRDIIHEDITFSIDINSLFDGTLCNKIDFLKIDVEGGEVEILNSITDENLKSLRCLAAEFHKTNEEFDIFQSNFSNRMGTLGFTSFTLYHGVDNNTNLRTLTFWKDEQNTTN
jgi:FkbM family methyltransferase